MLLLRDFGLMPSTRQARKACKLLLDGGLQRDGGINYGIWAKWTGRSETCVPGMVLSILSYFEYADARLDTLASHLPAQGRALVAAALVQREDLFRAGTPRRAQPLEYSARAAGSEVVGSEMTW